MSGEVVLRWYKIFCAGMVVITGVLVLVCYHPQVQELVLQLGERLKGGSLRGLEEWRRGIERMPLVFLGSSLLLLLSSFISCDYGKVSCPPSVLGFRNFFLSFPAYLSKNVPLLVLLAIAAFAIHGIKLGEQVIPIDTEIWLDDRYMNWREIGRFSLILLQGLTTLIGQNHYAVNFFTILFLVLGSLTWCYLLYVMSGWENKFPYLAFALVYCISPIWVDILYFTCLSLEVSLVMAFAPCVVCLLFTGLVRKSPLSIVFGCLALVFMTGVYQSLVVVSCCGLLFCYVFWCMSGNCSQGECRVVFFKGIACMVIVVLGYFVLENFVRQYIFRVSASDYLMGQAHLSPLNFCVAVPLQFLRMLRFWPAEIFLVFLFFPVLLVQEVHAKGSRWSKVGVVLILMSMFAFPLVTGGRASFRIQLMEPVVIGFAAFMVFARFGEGQRIMQRVFKGIFLGLCVLQLQSGALANYTDYLRYQQDKMVAHDIHRELQRLECGGVPVVLYGHYFPKYFVDHKISEVSGHSVFWWDIGIRPSDSTSRGLRFMRALGYDYASTDDEALIQKARLAAESMADYPRPGFVQNLGDVVVVRLSASSYVPE